MSHFLLILMNKLANWRKSVYLVAMHDSSWHGTQKRRYHRSFLLYRLLCTVAFLQSIISIPPTVVAADKEQTDKSPYDNKDIEEDWSESHEANENRDVRGPTKRIVGGHDAPKNRFPYFVSLRQTYDGAHKCGGSLVRTSELLSNYCSFQFLMIITHNFVPSWKLITRWHRIL